MKILLVTEREILDEDFFEWVKAFNETNGNRINANLLLSKGEVSWETDVGYTSAKTTLTIVPKEQ